MPIEKNAYVEDPASTMNLDTKCNEPAQAGYSEKI
jgi:hypothetical protein